MISSESRMRENRTSGLMSGGLETRSRESDCGPARKHRNSHQPLTLARQPPTLPCDSVSDRDRAPAAGTGNLHFD